MDADLNTLATALYARIDDALREHPELTPWRPKVGIAPKLSDAEACKRFGVSEQMFQFRLNATGARTRVERMRRRRTTRR